MKLALALFFYSKLIFASASGIDWYDGSIENAFKSAKVQNKPLFLYWGAVWCPPCNHIKKKIFSNSDFQKELTNFISVYLDGDTNRAQIWGEKLKASGYPTVLVLSPAGKELMRFPTSIDVKNYTKLLRSTLKRSLNIEELLKKKKYSNDEWSTLAFYSWGQNRELKNKFEIFKQLFEKVPTQLSYERASIFLLYLNALLKEKKEQVDKSILKKEFLKLMKNEELFKKLSGRLSYRGQAYIDFLFEKANERITQGGIFLELMNKVASDKKVTLDKRLSALIYEMNLVKEDKTRLKAFQVKLLKKVKETDLLAKDQYTRQDVMTTAIWMLQESKLLKEAKSYGLKELNKSVAPYYIMSSLASIEKEMGNIGELIRWNRQAWQSATGGNTKFQWGTSYLISLIENNKKKGLAKDFQTIINELLKRPDAFSGRNKKRFEGLKTALIKLKDKTLDLRIKSILVEECSKLKDGRACHESFKLLQY